MCGTKGAARANGHSMALSLNDFRDLKTQRHKTAEFLIYAYIY
jgi:hypothetical protein